MAHTELPWLKNDDGRHLLVITDTRKEKCICEIDLTTLSGFGPEAAEANAEFIVKAVNAYDPMLEALEKVWEDIELHKAEFKTGPVTIQLDEGTIPAIRAAIVTAKEEK